ncbi:MAG TPA: HAMP domain-containing sensor histidine kinase [Solirubrobacteraceae bacterium]|jgi:signal transduction histidine kinase|nr:HAMP domain-containing sensor histidine kinase [Solirubrobacteraceae bacterium]
MRRPYGLRPRLLAALVLTSAVTLAAAALTLLGPLQERLRQDTAHSLQAAVLASRPAIERGFPTRGRAPDYEEAYRLSQRTVSRVVLYDLVPREVYDTETGPMSIPRSVRRTFVDVRTTRDVTNADVRVTAPLRERAGGRLVGVLVASKPLTGVGETVDQVRAAFLTAAVVGLIVALLLGGGLASALLRRLERLRQSALQITSGGIAAAAPDDDTPDEVGDLARALATMQESLRRQENARRAFVATASHELRTPLTLLQGMLELLDDDLREGRVDLDDAREQIAGAQRQLRRLEHLASDLLDLSRLDSEAPLRSEPVELGELARAVAAEFDLRAADRDRSIDVVPPIAACWARGDPGAVARIVRILLDNALRFAPAGVPVRVAAAYHGERATVEVADAGPGVPPGERELIFERFRRGSATGGEEGFGLGLAIGRELARRLGGDLTLADDGAQPGARFVLSLPIELPAGSRAEPRQPVPSG